MTTVGVIGAGAMGSGIAQVALGRGGHRVLLTDASNAALATARSQIERGLRREVERGRLTDAEGAAARLRVVEPGDQAFAEFANCDLVVEAIAERLDAKQDLFRAVERHVGEHCVLATNTSSLSVTAIAAGCAAPERVVGLHFFNPAPVMALVEVVPGLRTAGRITQEAVRFAEALGKTAVLARDTPGFIVNRVARPFYGEALCLYDQGIADPATIDWAMTELGGFRMGPFALMDFIGHDVNYAVTESVWTATYFDPRYRPSLTQKRLVEARLLGKKSGRGFYAYAEGAVIGGEPMRDQTLGERLVSQIVAMLVNEAVDAVHLGIASRRDIELAMTKGVGYPRGLLAWGDAVGAAAIVAQLDRLRDETGDARYRASVLLRQHARSGAPLAP
jgi:3-hydroxybutyryl-CoA dehydrogenase